MQNMITVRRDSISPELKNSIFIRDGKCCRYCGQKNGQFHLDHVYPVSKGGETSIDNLVTSCQSCNSKKHDKVGIWPKPIGYFNTTLPQNPISPLTVCSLSLGLGLVSLGFVPLFIELSFDRIFLFSGFLLCSLGLGRTATGR